MKLDRFDIHWEVEADGEVLASGVIEKPSVDPRDSKIFRIPAGPLQPQAGTELFLNLSARTREKSGFVPKGHPVATEQLVLSPDFPAMPEQRTPRPAVEITEDFREIIVSGKDFYTVFDRMTGILASFRFEGRELVESGPEPNFWRAPTDNDFGNQMNRRLAVWRRASLHRDLNGLAVRLDTPGRAVVEVEYLLPSVRAIHTIRYEIHGDGEIRVLNSFSPGEEAKLPEIPRVGMKMAMPQGFENIQWFGRGPWENYSDRKTAASVGVYSTSLSTQVLPYVSPQEYGNRTDTRWLAVRDPDGYGLLVSGDPLFEFSVLPYWPEDLTLGERGAKHPPDVLKRDYTCLTIDYAQMGVGGDDSWGARVHSPYILPARAYTYSFRLLPLGPKDIPAAVAKGTG